MFINTAVVSNRQYGFTLLEVLIAIVITSIGVLGLAGLQAASLRNNHSAYLRGQATLLAYDMADRMRANMAGFQRGLNDNNPYSDPTLHMPNDSAGCSTQYMAQNDAFEWNAAITSLLPSGAGVVCRDGTPDDGTSAVTGMR